DEDGRALCAQNLARAPQKAALPALDVGLDEVDVQGVRMHESVERDDGHDLHTRPARARGAAPAEACQAEAALAAALHRGVQDEFTRPVGQALGIDLHIAAAVEAESALQDRAGVAAG